MKLGAMLGDVIRSLFKTPITEYYPYQKKAAPQRLRGKLLWNRESCTGCGLCAKDCPAGALDVIVIDKKAKKIVMNYDADHCIYMRPVRGDLPPEQPEHAQHRLGAGRVEPGRAEYALRRRGRCQGCPGRTA
jgi:ferredoxin